MSNQFGADPPFLQTEEFLPPVNRWASIGGLLVVGVLGAAVVLSGLIKYDVTVKASGRVRPQWESQLVQAQTDGIISSIELREHQEVEAGDVLAYLETSATPQIRTLQTQQQERLANVDMYRTQLGEAEVRVESLRSQILQKSEWIAIAGSTRTPNEANPNYTVALALEKLAASSPQEAEQLKKQWEDAVKKQTQLERQIQLEATALIEIESQIEAGALPIPADGTILKLNLQSPGQRVRAGEVLAEIVPDEPLVIRARVAVSDIGKVEVGQSVQLRVSAYPYTDYGLLPGVVQAIAPDTTAPNNGLGVAPYYEVTIEPERAYLVRQDVEYPLKAGMDVNADITTNRETVLRSLLRRARLWVDG